MVYIDSPCVCLPHPAEAVDPDEAYKAAVVGICYIKAVYGYIHPVRIYHRDYVNRAFFEKFPHIEAEEGAPPFSAHLNLPAKAHQKQGCQVLKPVMRPV